eukprot:jgi/Mesen1/6460/ME000033S05756
MINSLGFNTAASLHNYTIVYLPNSIQWLVDGNLIRQVNCLEVSPYICPSAPLSIYLSLFDAVYVSGAIWAGPINYALSPFYANFRNLMVWPA